LGVLIEVVDDYLLIGQVFHIQCNGLQGFKRHNIDRGPCIDQDAANLLPTAVSGNVQRAIVVDSAYQKVFVCEFYAGSSLGGE
jgi:hypothetical protein